MYVTKITKYENFMIKGRTGKKPRQQDPSFNNKSLPFLQPMETVCVFKTSFVSYLLREESETFDYSGWAAATAFIFS